MALPSAQAIATTAGFLPQPWSVTPSSLGRFTAPGVGRGSTVSGHPVRPNASPGQTRLSSRARVGLLRALVPKPTRCSFGPAAPRVRLALRARARLCPLPYNHTVRSRITGSLRRYGTRIPSTFSPLT